MPIAARPLARSRLAPVVATLLPVACGGGGGSGPVASSDVHGTIVNGYTSATQSSISAMVQNPIGFTLFTAAAGATGLLVTPNLPGCLSPPPRTRSRSPSSLRPVLTPPVSPPRRPTISSLDGLAQQTGVGLTPRLAWDLPDHGAPDGYSVTLYRLDNVGGRNSFTPQAFSRGTSRHLDLPAGMLVSGQTYPATIAALHAPAFDPARPLHASYPVASASVVLAPFSP